jgi:hypothetical protein
MSYPFNTPVPENLSGFDFEQICQMASLAKASVDLYGREGGPEAHRKLRVYVLHANKPTEPLNLPKLPGGGTAALIEAMEKQNV